MKEQQKLLLTFMAKACSYAQEHIDDLQAWPSDETERARLLQCTSYQMACFLAQNTENGHYGVEWEVVLDELVQHPRKPVTQWKKILLRKVKDFGGWK